MKPSPRTNIMSAEIHHRRNDGSDDDDDDSLVILLPDPMVLRLIARSVLLAAALISLPWLRTMPIFSGGGGAAAYAADPRWIDNPFLLPMLVIDLKREGLFTADCRAVFLGHPSSRVDFLKKNHIQQLSEYQKLMLKERSVDFVLAVDGFGDSSFGFVDRILKVGGIITLRLGSESFHLPPNYRIAYIRRFGSTIVAIKKSSHAHANADDLDGRLRGRKMLSISAKDTQLKIPKMLGVSVHEVKKGVVNFIDEMGLIEKTATLWSEK